MIHFAWNSAVADILDPSQGEVTAVKLRNVKSDEETIKPVAGVFIGIGHSPNTAIFRGQIDLNENGYIITHDGSKTNIPGVFARW